MTGTLAAAALLTANSIRDLQKKEILLLPTIVGGAAGVVWQAVMVRQTVPELLLSLLPGALLMALGIGTGGRIGCGDGIALCAVGAWVGIEQAACSLIAALCLVPAAAGLLHLTGRKRKELPFLPFLLTGHLMLILLNTGW